MDPLLVWNITLWYDVTFLGCTAMGCKRPSHPVWWIILLIVCSCLCANCALASEWSRLPTAKLADDPGYGPTDDLHVSRRLICLLRERKKLGCCRASNSSSASIVSESLHYIISLCIFAILFPRFTMLTNKSCSVLEDSCAALDCFATSGENSVTLSLVLTASQTHPQWLSLLNFLDPVHSLV